MSSIVFNQSSSYANIGASLAWRHYLLDHSSTAWLKTSSQIPACLISLSNDSHEIFSVDINISPDPQRDGASILVEGEYGAPPQLVSSCGFRQHKDAPLRASRPTRLDPDQLRHLRGICAGGVRVKIDDEHRNTVVAESFLPVLADDRWHFLKVTVHGNNVSLEVDGLPINVIYKKKDSLVPLSASGVSERPVYPSRDLIGARHVGLRVMGDFFCGSISDVSVETPSHKRGAIHLWQVVLSSGSTVWDRGSSPWHPRGVNMNLCDCRWDAVDFPPTSLSLNSSENRIGQVPALSRQFIDELIHSSGESHRESLFAHDDKGEAAENEPLERESYNGVDRPTAALRLDLHSTNSDVPSTASTTPREAVRQPHSTILGAPSAPQGYHSRHPVNICFWIKTTDDRPCVILSIPCREPLHVITNIDFHPSVALMKGCGAFVSQCNICDGQWHHINWAITPECGVSLYVDDNLSTWEFRKLQWEEESADQSVAHESAAGSIASPSASPRRQSRAVGTSAASISEISVASTIEDSLNPAAFDAGSVNFDQVPLHACPRSSIRGEASDDDSESSTTLMNRRREMMRMVQGMALQKGTRFRRQSRSIFASTTLGGESDSRVDFSCLTLGYLFSGELRDMALTIGPFQVTWQFNQGTGITVQPFVGSSSLTLSEAVKRHVRVLEGCVLELQGLNVIYPKTLLPPQSLVLSDTTVADLGTVRLPRHLFTTGVDLHMLVRLLRNAEGEKQYGNIFSLDGVVVLRIVQEKIEVCVAHRDSVATQDIWSSEPPDPGTFSDAEMAEFLCHTTIFEDGQWHHVHLLIPFLGRLNGIQLIADDVPLELIPMGGPHFISGDEQDHLRPEKPLEGSQHSQSMPGHPHKKISGELLNSSAASPNGSPSFFNARACCGDFAFRGSVRNVSLITNGISYEWLITEGAKRFISRRPLQSEILFASHNRSLTCVDEALNTPCRVVTKKFCEPLWKRLELPERALHFDGCSAFVSAVDVSRAFPPSHMSRFAVSIWMRSGSKAIQPGCILSIHDLLQPSLEGSLGIFTHTKLNVRASPKKRHFAANTTCFVLSDSCERTLGLEIETDIYDGVWHKLHWVVHSSSLNETQVFVDDIPASSLPVCAENPREFEGTCTALNLGARNEGASGVVDYFDGELRSLEIATDVDADVLNWSIAEGEGNVCFDRLGRTTGCIVNPIWVSTSFPPKVPVLSLRSTIEFSPVNDIEAAFRDGWIKIDLTVRSNMRRHGTLLSVVSISKVIVCSIVLNEGGDFNQRNIYEPGVHRLSLQRITRKSFPTGDIDNDTDGAVRFSVPDRREWNEAARQRTLSVDAGLRSVPAHTSHTETAKARVQSKTALKERLQSCAQLKEASQAKGGANSPKQMMTVVEELTYQFVYEELCNGNWHRLEAKLCHDQSDLNAVVIDGSKIPLKLLATRNVHFLPANFVEVFSTLPRSDLSKPREPMQQARDELTWGSIVIGKPTSDYSSFRGCVKNLSIWG